MINWTYSGLSRTDLIPRSLPTRLLHGLLAAAIVYQLVGSLVMNAPKPGMPANLAFELHESVGLATVGLLAAFWLRTLVRRRGAGLRRSFRGFRRRAARR
jgi:cytochrome b561